MKKALLIMLMLTLAVSILMATDRIDRQLVPRSALDVRIDPRVDGEKTTSKIMAPQEALSSYGPGTFLMNSGYDYPNNGNMQRNIINYGDGTMAIARMASTSTTNSDRGSWWSYFDGTSWSEMVKIEGQRRGWTDTDVLSDGRQVVVSHVGNEVNIDALKGYGLWTSYLTGYIDDFNISDHIWPRIGIDGMDRIHIVSCFDTPTPIRGVRYGKDYPIYSRSDDQGLNWTHDYIFGDPYSELDTTHGQWQGSNIDNYPVDCFGDNKVATISVPSMDTWVADIWVAESNDYGQTWNTQNITQNPRLPAADEGLWAPTNGVDMAYDNDGNIHVVATHYLILLAEDGVNADVYHSQYAPLAHWSEEAGWTVICSYLEIPDYDSTEQVFDATGGQSTVNDAGAGNNTLLKSPSIGFDSEGNMFVTFATVAPGDTLSDGTNMYDVYAIASKDGGASWGKPVNITNTDGSNPRMEDIDASLAKLVDDKLHIVYNSDPQFGYDSDTGAEPYRTNMMYYSFPKDEILESAIAVRADDDAEVPAAFKLRQNYPNPFNPSTTITFAVSRAANVNLSVYDVTGKLVATLVNEKMSGGTHSYNWDAGHVASGVYFAKLQSGDFSAVKKMTLIR